MIVSFFKMLGKFVFLVTLVAFVTYTEAKDNDNCDHLGVLLYEEISCKPVKEEASDVCPSSYDCSHLDEKGDHCYFRGIKVKDDELLPKNASSGTCTHICYCSASAETSLSKFVCALAECPEFISRKPLKNPHCKRTYELNSCCSKDEICPPFDNIATCEVDGVIYKEGQKFSPKDTCQTCVCQKGFAGKYETPFCKREICAVELWHAEDIKNNCAPAYKSNGARCCPELWICPKETDTFSPPETSDTSAKSCKFGEKEIKRGQILQTVEERYGKKLDVKCDCQVPPKLTCIIA